MTCVGYLQQQQHSVTESKLNFEFLAKDLDVQVWCIGSLKMVLPWAENYGCVVTRRIQATCI
jgi:hypothetical protein